jgi:CPA2 family monovalent cation:H+ antiporter-2
MSSTAVLSKLLAERMELDSSHGREVLGVLLFQDLAVVPLLILIPAFATQGSNLGWVLTLAALRALLALSLILFFGQRLMRAWFNIVAQRKSAELFMLNVLCITLGLGLLTEMAGLSLGLGAFMAGMLISETEYRYQVEEDIKPFRDVLMGFFFITIGMLLDLRVVASQALWVVLVLLSLLALKFGLITLLSRLFGSTPGTALRSGLWLCAGGEFGFVLLSQIERVELLPPAMVQIVLTALVLSMLAAPIFAHFSDKIVLRLVPSEWLMRSMQLTSIAARSMQVERHAIICGYGRNGQYMARFLEQEGISYIALDLDPDRVREAAAAGDTVVFGDAAKRETLVAAGISRAAVVVVTYASTASAMEVIRLAHELGAQVPVVVRSLDETDYDKLLNAGATEVVPESLESSIMLSTHALVLLGVPLKRVVARIREIRGARYKLLRGIYHGAEDAVSGVDAHSHQSRLHTVILTAGAAAVGRRLGDVNLDRYGVTVSAIRRRNIRALEPGDDTVLAPDDALVLLGDLEGLAAAEGLLMRG